MNPFHGSHAATRTQIHCGIFHPTSTGLELPLIAGPNDALVFVVDLSWPQGIVQPSLSIGFGIWRGEECRYIEPTEIPCAATTPWRAAYELHWRQRPGASSRLECRVLLGRAEIVARCQILVAGFTVDGQGRLDASERSDSNATRLAYENLFAARFLRDAR